MWGYADLMLMGFTILVVIYLVIGLLFGAIFVFKGVGVVDPMAGCAPLVFRVMILPGSVALWPVLLGKWLRVRRGGRDDA
jgi:hypothetical protein